MRIVVAGTHQYPISFNWVTMERASDVVKPETLNDPWLKTSLMMCAKASI